MAFRAGGYFLSDWGVGAAVLLAFLSAEALGGLASWPGRLGVAALMGWFALAAWQGLSAAWADEPARATEAMHRTLLYGATFGLILLGLQKAAWLRRITDIALLTAAGVGAYAVAARLLPDYVGGDHQARLSTPITYWNGLGALLAFAAVLALGTAGHPARRLASRAGAAALVPLCMLGMLFTLSRGAALVFVLGILVLLALAPGRLETAAAVVSTVGVSLPLILLANAEEALVSFEPLPPHVAEGRRMALLLVGAMVLSATIALLLALGVRNLGERTRRTIGASVIGAAGIGVAVAIVLGPPDGNPITWADRQFESFRRFEPGARAEAATIHDRLAVAAGSGRWQMWQVAVEEVETAPLTGTGAGDYRFWWHRERPIDLYVENAHSLYLEVLGESGAVGLALLLIPAIAGLLAIGRSLERGPPLPLARDLGIAVAACSVVALHLAGDWDWQLTAVVLPAVGVGAAAVKAAFLTQGGARSAPLWARLTVGALCLGALYFLLGPLSSAGRVKDARAAAAAGNFAEALPLAREAVRLDPQSADARLLEGNLLTDLGRHAEADAAFAGALARSPHRWEIYADWASALLRRGEREPARLLIRRALVLNPREPRLEVLRGSTGVSPTSAGE